MNELRAARQAGTLQPALRFAHAPGVPLARENYAGTVRDFLLWLAQQDAMTD